MVTIPDRVRELVALQRELTSAIRKGYPLASDAKWLLDFPKAGEVDAASTRWRFKRHGAGMRFERVEPQPSHVVEIHSHFTDPAFVDEWRLSLFLESVGGDTDREGIRDALERMCENGQLVRLEQGFRLAE